jgi:thiol-disulfide isomerase/thioredoxin
MKMDAILRRVVMMLFAALGAAAVAAAASGTADVKLISQGREVTLEEHLVPGKLVVFDFFADWCAPCRYVTPVLERLAEQHPDRLALRTIDVVDWSSPVARQHGLSAIPHLVLFGPDGTRLAEGDAQRVLDVLESQLGVAAGELAAARGGSTVPAPVWLALAAALVTGSLLLTRRGRAQAVVGRRGPAIAPDLGADSPKIWFAVVRGSLEGPYSVDQLAGLRRSGVLAGSARVRRRGDATWQKLDDVVGSAGDR